MVGQANQLYLRSDKTEDTLTLQWGKQAHQQCRLHYQAPKVEDTPIQLLSAPCR